MKETVSSNSYALQANSDKYDNIPYSKLDCQGFVEEVLKDCGVKKPDGSCYNWKGSNSMWRNALKWKGTISECKKLYGSIPLGSWVFIVKNDGGEIDRGYHDSEGNAAHVGIYCREGDEPVRDSTKTSKRDGVGYRRLEGFTHVGLPKMILFDSNKQILDSVSILRNTNSSDSEFLQALVDLTNFIKGV